MGPQPSQGNQGIFRTFNLYVSHSSHFYIHHSFQTTTWNIVMSEQLEEAIIGLWWNDSISVALFTVMSYEYLLLLDKEVKYVWNRPWSLMSYLYLVVRYLGLSLAIIWGCWGGMFIYTWITLLLHSCCTGMGCVCIFLLCRSHSYLASLRTLQPIEAPTLCCSRVILAYCRPFNRHRYLFV